jgi:Arc/MetJ-type ribon-helix-helix transcriptional regulator
MEGKTGSNSDLVRLAVRLIIEEAVEGAAEDTLGRGHYAPGCGPGSGVLQRQPDGAADHRLHPPAGIRWRLPAVSRRSGGVPQDLRKLLLCREGGERAGTANRQRRGTGSGRESGRGRKRTDQQRCC